ncbi:hypothetical protein LTR10_000789 [Elasticomyces elasticus]|nr:hypothetical protein LTR10_000789 [Elasticomyces elasticus]
MSSLPKRDTGIRAFRFWSFNRHVLRLFCQVTRYPIQGNIEDLSSVELSLETTKRLLRSKANNQINNKLDGEALLDTVRGLDVWTADRLASRDVSLEEFRFRVVQASERGHMDSQSAALAKRPLEYDDSGTSIDSYTAVSYCWHYEDWSAARELEYDELAPVVNALSPQPLMPAMLAAVLDERSTKGESIWLDQWCIDQEDTAERSTAVGITDLVYSNARIVTVCLEDVRLDQEDMQTLLDFGEFLAHADFDIPKDGDLTRACQWDGRREGHLLAAMYRILNARWFTRAWCAHESWLGSNKVFLVPITMDPDTPVEARQSSTILRFDFQFLAKAHLVSMAPLHQGSDATKNQSIHHWKDHLMRKHKYFWDTLDFGGFEHYLSEETLTFGMSMEGAIVGPAGQPSFQQFFAYANALSASKAQDRLSVALNMGQTQLRLRSTDGLSTAETAWIVTIVALALGEVSILAATGPFIKTVGNVWNTSKDQPGWAVIPGPDIYLRLDERIVKHKLPLTISEDGLQLNMIQIASSSEVQKPESPSTSLAEQIVNYLFDRNMIPRIAIKTSLHHQHLIQALGCLITGGADWTIVVAAWARDHPADFLRIVKYAVSKDEIRTAFQVILWMKMQALLKQFSIDDEPTIIFMGDSGALNLIEDLDAVERMQSLDVLLDIADSLVRTVIGEHKEYRQGKINKDYRLQIVVKNIGDHGGLVIFAPPADEHDYELACPELLQEADRYNTNMRKGWILKKIAEHGGDEDDETLCPSYRLLGKTAIFMPLAPKELPLQVYQAERVLVR